MPRVLIAASPDLIAELDRSILGRSGVERVLALRPEQAFEAVRSAKPHLVLLGETEGADPCALLRRLRSDPETRAISLAVISRKPPTHNEEAALRRAGANVVITADMVPELSEASIELLLDVPLRRELQAPVRFVVWSHVGPDTPAQEGRAINVSVRGLLLETPEPVVIGSKLELAFLLPGDPAEVRAVGKAVREHPWGKGTQIGVEFLILRGDGRDRIRSYVATARES
jgi:CheY-like chemotaxis protein